MPRRGENIRKRTDGRWEGRYKIDIVDNKAKYVSVYGKTYKEVKAKLRLRSISEIPPPNPNISVNFKDILLMWLDLNKLRHKKATTDKYKYLIISHIIPVLGNTPLNKITAQTFNDFAQLKLKSGRLNGIEGLSSAYVRSMMIIIKSAYNLAVTEGFCQSISTPIYLPPVAKKDLKILNQKDLLAFENYLVNNIDETKLGVLLSLNCGLRIGEICSLKWSDIDLEQKTVSVNSTVTRIKSSDLSSSVLVIDRPKTIASVRNVPIHSKLLKILTDCKSKAKSEFVISKKPEFVSPRTFEYRFHRLLEKCQIQALNFHALRHTFATRCIVAGMDVKTLSEILGHTNTSITVNIRNPHNEKAKQPMYYKQSLLTIKRFSSVGCFYMFNALYRGFGREHFHLICLFN